VEAAAEGMPWVAGSFPITKIFFNHSKLFKMKKPDYLILLCNSYRMVGEAKGTCLKRGSSNLIQYITEEAADRGLDVAVTTTACLNICPQGPVIIVQPNNYWYGGITDEDKIDQILEALEDNKAVEEYLIAD